MNRCVRNADLLLVQKGGENTPANKYHIKSSNVNDFINIIKSAATLALCSTSTNFSLAIISSCPLLQVLFK